MNGKPPTGVFRIARSGDAVYVRVVGLATMQNSTTFKEFADRMQADGYRRFVVDLAECRGVDSTFMGLLLGLACGGGERRDALVIVNANAHCRKQLESIGLHRLLKIQAEPADLPKDLALHELPEAEASPVQRLKLIMKAHQDLIAIDKKNEEKFGAFLRDIAKNLGRGDAPPAPPGGDKKGG
jgi:anti-anti-sigma regulatory factor